MRKRAATQPPDDLPAPASEPEAFVLVVPDTALGPTRGAGQRSAILYAALKSMGPTRIVIVGKSEPTRITETFPDHDGIWQTGTRSEVASKRPMTEKLLGALGRYIFVSRNYRYDPVTHNMIRDRLVEQPAAVVFRYFRPFSLSGITNTTPGARLVMVDVDDRDDQRLGSSVNQAIRIPFMQRLLDVLVLKRIRSLMRSRLTGATHAWFASEEDARDFEIVPSSVLRNVSFVTVENGTLPPPSSARDVLFVGIAGHRPNVEGVRWFLRECWPEIRRRHPNARFRLVGMGNWSKKTRFFHESDGFDVIGYAPDLAAEYARARLVIAPVLEGGGSKIKVIEACAFGRPVAVMRHSSRGYGPEIEHHLAIAGNAAEFIDSCDRFLSDPADADKTGATLRKLQQSHFSPQVAHIRILNDIRQHLTRPQDKDL
ncbi:Glycosyl transferases group 1 [Roseovarius pacificus]|uniref:Glycosyl transferases group 1 n=1 Tax=Roseovarius pacificus TaxID=337701 RepID=A0A1M7HLP4_9RHOB|nr:glycosyltransferase family 4 protein [Roseovarius pacificus]GGO60665.1 hypothetical protein GCM10011315_35620 [Roseovarius pacificus]SHM29461.1 Glycosyl transferases group 1 [Roseovarius pacificus]